MAQSLKLPDVLTVDSRLTVASHKAIVIRKGAANTTQQRTTASSISNSQVVYNVQLNNGNSTIIDRYMEQEITFSVSIGATGLTGMGETVKSFLGGGLPGVLPGGSQGNFALRQYPIASITNTLSVQVNQQQVTSTPSQYIHELAWFQNLPPQSLIQSITPIMPDQAPDYSPIVGSLKNPLSTYAAGGEHYSESRGSFNASFIDNMPAPTATLWSFNVTIREPLMNPFLDYDITKRRAGLPFVQLFNVQSNFLANISRIFSLNDPMNNITGITVNVIGATLVQTWLTAPTNMNLPPVAVLDYNTVVANQTSIPTTFGAIGSGNNTQTVVSQSYQLNQIPKKLWIYVKNNALDVANGYLLSDFTFPISAITVQFNNQAGLLSNWTATDIYNNCMAEEGGRMSFMQSQYFTGCVLSLDPVKLFGLQNDETAGLLGTFQLSVTVTCNNPSTITPFNANLFVTWAMDSIMTITQEGTSNITQGFIRKEDVVMASSLPSNPSVFSEKDIYGGRFGDRIKALAQKALSFVKNNKLISKALPYAAQFIPEAAPFIPAAQQIAQHLGVGRVNPRQLRSIRSRAMRM